MLETFKVGCIMLYSQATMFIPGLIRGFEPEFSFISLLNHVTFCYLFLAFQTFLYHNLPADTMYGTITPAGNKPEYRNNGISAWFVTLFTQYYIMNEFFTVEELMNMVDSMSIFHWALNLIGFHVSALMFLKVFIRDKSVLSEPVRTCNFLVDFYKGIELHPKLTSGMDLKLLINSRFGMMLWGCIVFLVVYVSKSVSVLTSGAVQLMYITKFFAWEDGYVKTADITLDRCGYYLFWGCCCYVPTFYTSTIMYHYYNPVEINPILGVTFMILGYFSVFANWKCDTYRTEMREFAEKNPEIAEKPGFNFIKAQYKTSDGKINSTWLVSSGYYRLCRHPSYFFEILTTVIWTLPGYIPNEIICYAYLIFLTILLIHRTYRLDKKCEDKYKESWLMYKIIVPYRIVPCIF